MAFKKGDKRINRKGRPKGTGTPEIVKEIRQGLLNHVEENLPQLLEEIDQLKPKDKIKAYLELLPYVLPRLQATQLKVNFDKMTDEQLDQVIKTINSHE